MCSVVDVTRQRVDPRHIHAVPTIVVNNSTAHSGRAAFVWLIDELKRVIVPAMCEFGGMSAASLDGSDMCGRNLSSVNFKEPERMPEMSSMENESIESRLSRMKADRGT